ncbi:MAG: hypothetical protein M1113_02250 [Candidatus Thermoplasmatota archaeon]|nr:hypothetical protein [Candidatus Thermoplasmatota archaeon]
MSEQHKRSFSLTTGRQRSIFISYLKRLGYIEWQGRETIQFGEFKINYRCEICSATVESGQIINHYRFNKNHFIIAEKILQEMAAKGEVANIPIIS